MKLTSENYYSKESNLHYMSVSQYKSFMKCEAATMHWLTADVQDDDTDALMVGKYIHAWSEQALDSFKEQNAGYIFNKKGEPYAPFKKADEMIACLEADPKVMFYLQGGKEVILTADLFEVPWKVRIDIDNSELNYLADLKSTKSITETSWVWSPEQNKNIKVSFIEEYNYLIQAAVYSEVERIARGRDTRHDFYLIAVSKEKVPDHAIIDLTDHERIEAELEKIRQNLPRIIAVKSGEEAPARCEQCDYCRATKKVDKIIHYTELMPA